ncbi:MAG: RNA polymerase sigma factor [Tepidisphaerales bacterium]
MTDGELVHRARAGETSAFDTLVRRWFARVLAVCRARTDRTAAEDLAQEAFLRGLRAVETLDEPEKFGPWVCGIAARACMDHLKHKARKAAPIGESAGHAAYDRPDGQPGPPERLQRAESLARLMAAVEQLPEPLREVIMMYYYDDCTYAELAGRLGVSPATVNARLTEARQLLRRRLGENRQGNHEL